MAYFPFMVDIKDMNCLVAGGGNIALHKVKILLEYGVNINIVAPGICNELIEIAKDEHIKIYKRKFCEEDINGMAFVIAATDSREVNMHISEICHSKNVHVNVVDIQEACTFIFPAIIHEKNLLVAISSEGKSPVAAANIKKKIKDIIPDYYSDMIGKLGRQREYILEHVEDKKHRKEIFKELLEYGENNNGDISDKVVKGIVEKNYEKY